MTLFSFLSKKIDPKTIIQFNCFLNFDYIPKMLHSWADNKISFEGVINYEFLGSKKPEWKSLIKKTTVTSSRLNHYPNITLYLIKGPSTGMISEVAMSIIATNKNKGYLFYTLENTIGGFVICSADERGNHYNTGITIEDGNQFGEFVIKEAIKRLNGPTFCNF